MFLVQGFPGVGFVEEKIEEDSIFFSQGRSPSWTGIPSSLVTGARRPRRASTTARACSKSSREPSVVAVGVEAVARGLCGRGQIGPVGRNQRFTAIGQDQNEKQPTFPMHRPENVERLAFERMASADNSDLLGEVLMMGSVS